MNKKEVSVISLSANYVQLGLKLVSSNEYEGHYVLELLLRNQSNLQSQIHSTDMHGINDINFALLELCGYQFAPRFTKISMNTLKIYSYNHPNCFSKEYPLKPINKINKELILDEKENIIRIILSLKMKKTSVGVLVKKLYNSPKNNKTRKALVELNKIFRSKYLMNYIDNPSMRQSVQTALNRGEAYHQLTRAISYAHDGKIITSDIEQQELFKESTRLIANVIIYFHYLKKNI